MGKYSLQIYLLHTVIFNLLAHFAPSKNLGVGIVIYLLTLLLCGAGIYCIENLGFMVMKNMDFSKVYLASFADKRMAWSLRRLGRQAQKIGIFREHIRLFSEDSLDRNFINKFQQYLRPNVRGFGYWCWKPQVVLQAFDTMKDGDILLYLDAGCHINPKGIIRFEEYLSIADKKGFLGFQYYSLMGGREPDRQHHIRLESEYSKGEVIDFFQVRNNSEILNSSQFSGGVFFVKKTKDNILLFKNFIDIITHNFKLIDDSISSNNISGFIAPRHDQSIFSIMMKLSKKDSLSACEIEPLLHHAPTEYAGNRNWGRKSFGDMAEFPIHVRHDKFSNISSYILLKLKMDIRLFLSKIKDLEMFK